MKSGILETSIGAFRKSPFAWRQVVGLAVAGLLPTLAAGSASAAQPPKPIPATPTNAVNSMNEKVVKTDEEWRRQLTPEQYRILRQKGTERAFTGKFWNYRQKGVYRCAACGQSLFDSGTKFDSGCGWPSYFAPLQTNAITTRQDLSHGMQRVEVLCSRCGGHLGHVFDDGPRPTGLRYCINSAALEFSTAIPGTKSGKPSDQAEGTSATTHPPPKGPAEQGTGQR